LARQPSVWDGHEKSGIRNLDKQMKAWLPPTVLMATFTVGAWAQLERPQVAWMLDAQGNVRPVLGLAGSPTLGDPVARNILSVACFPETCLAKTEGAVYSSLGWAAEAPEGPAVFSVGATADLVYIYFYSTGQVAKWHGGQLEFVDFTPGGEILSLRAAAEGFDYAVAREGGTVVEHFSMETMTVTPVAPLGGTGPVLLLDGAVLAATEDAVKLIRCPAPAEDTDFLPAEFALDIPGAGQFFLAGNGYIQVNTKTGARLLRMNGSCRDEGCWPWSADVFVLPPPPPPGDAASGNAGESVDPSMSSNSAPDASASSQDAQQPEAPGDEQ
jgi:hypothetical protein